MKKLLSSLCIGALLLTSIPTASANEIYEYSDTQTIVKGVTRTDVSKHMGSYRLAYHIITADLTEPHLKLDLLKSNSGVDQLETVATLAENTPGTVAAINADFFSWFSGGLGFSLGLEVKDGNLLASPIEPDKMGTALVDDTGHVNFSYLTFNRTITAPNGESTTIRHTNKHTTYYGDVILYTSDFNHGMTPAPGGNAIEVVVEDDTVTQIRIGEPSVEIPKNGYVLASDIGMNGFLNNNFQVGDKVEITLTASPNLENVQTAFGGGSLLVKDGKVTTFTHNASGYNPRSAVGVDKNGTKVYIVAVDGRQAISRGMTQNELADLMIQLGCYNAMNLDGGGSTRLLTSSASAPTLNVANSPTEDRKVINGIGISSSAPVGVPVRLEATASQKGILLGDAVPLNATAYDAYDHMVPATNEIMWGMSGIEGEMLGSALHPTSSGVAYASAYFGDIYSNALSFTVYDSLAGISMPDSISVGVGESSTPKIIVFTKDGKSFPVHTLFPFQITCDTSILKVENGAFVGVSQGVTPVTIGFGDTSTTVLAMVGGAQEKPRSIENQYQDPMMSQKDSGFVFRVGVRNPENTCLADLTNNKIESILSEANESAFLGSSVKSSKRLPTGKLAREDKDNCLFMTLDISKGGLFDTDTNQWDTIDNAVKSSPAHHIFFVFDSPISQWTNEEDKQLFMDYLAEKSGNRNFFVIFPGEKNSLLIQNGVRYFTVADSSKRADTYENITTLSCLSFSVNGGNISYRWMPVYDPK